MKKTNILVLAFLFTTIKLNAQTSNQGLYFNAGIPGKLVSINDNPAYQLGTGSFTFETWIRMNTIQASNSNTLFSKNSTAGLRIYLAFGKLTIGIGGAGYLPGQFDFRDSICHHISIVRNDTTLYTYIDGNLYGTNTGVTQNMNSNAVIYIGSSSTSGATFFGGLIHEMRLWNVPRTQSQIQAAKDVFLTGNEAGLIGYWRMNDGSGQTVNDLSIVNNDGYLGSSVITDPYDPVYQSPNCICSITSATITPNGPVTFCSGGSVTLTANTGAGFSYQWKLNGSNVSGATSQNYVASAAGNYTVQVANSAGCSALSTATTVTVNSAPSATIFPNGSTTFCAGNNLTLTANTGAGYTWQWKLNGNNISGATSQNYTTSQPGNYTVAVTNSSGCSAVSSITTVTVNSPPSATVTPGGPTTFCAGGNVTLTANSGTGLLYQWKLAGNNINGATSLNYTATQGGNYSVAVTNSLGCSAISSIVTVTLNPLPVATTNPNGPSPFNFCSGTSFTITAGSGAGYGYQWLLNTVAIAGATSQTYSASVSGDYTVVVVNTCGQISSPPVHLNANSPPQTVITHTTGNPLTTLSVSHSAGAHYQWYESQYLSNYVMYFRNDTSLLVGHSGYFVCEITNACGTYVTPQEFVNISSPAGIIYPNGTPTNYAYVCPAGDSVKLVNVDSNLFFSWVWLKDGLVFSPANGPVCYAKQPGNYTCEFYGAFQGLVSNIVTVLTLDPPVAAISPPDPVSICSGQSVLLSNVYSGLGYTFQWKKDGINILGATYHNYTANSAGSYTLVITNTCGTATSAATTVTVNPLPSATITAGGSTTFCGGGSVVLNAPVNANYSYQWKKNNANISGATLSSYTATTGGNYKVIVTNIVTGCSKTSASATVVNVNALPTATITPQGSTTFCAGGSVVLAANTGAGLTYLWKKGNNFISGATLSNYTATTAGTYRVQITNSNGCSKLSAGTVVSVPCREGEIISSINNFDFTVYPNPNAGEFTIEFSNKPSSPLSIELTDELGKVVKKFETDDETIVIKESKLAKGIYCLTVRNKNEVVKKKISVVE